MSSRIFRTFFAALITLCLTFPAVSSARTIKEKPSAMAMTGDAIVVRPALLAITLVGSGIFLVSLPFSALGGNAGEAANVLVIEPAKATFVRCLGCTISGRAVSEIIPQSEEE